MGTFFAVIYIWGNLFFYPGYQRFFSRAAETETGNRARKVSGTRGIIFSDR